MKAPIRLSILTLAIAGLVPTPATAAATCQVPSASYPTIQSAVNDANCTELELGGQTFNEDVSIDRSLTITGAGSGSTIIDGTGSIPAVDLTANTARQLSIAGLTITGGGGSSCAGLNVSGTTHSVTLTDVLISGNVADFQAGVCLVRSSRPCRWPVARSP